jgi:hypothetical protein
VYFSEELYNARKFGYEFEVLWGYTFQRGNIFNKYVDDMYNIRLSYPKTDPMNYTAKLLLNSLYGKFGMEDNYDQTKILNNKEYLKMEKESIDSILDVTPLGDKFMVKYKDFNLALDKDLDNSKHVININIAIASAVTAYARIHMSQFKHPDFLKAYNLKLFYTDTDSLYFNGPIPDSLLVTQN